MPAITRHIFSLALAMLALANMGHAQQSGMYVPKGGKIFFNGDTATIFSNLVNDGKLGVGKKAVVNFKGKNWKNSTNAQITNESNAGEGTQGSGGVIRFNGVDSGRQQIEGGYNAATRQGASFDNLQIDNVNGVELNASTAKVRNELRLTNGRVYLLDNVLVVGDFHPGTITGYDSARFIVTGNAGLLMRENIRSRDSWVVFPIGSNAQSYTPVSLQNKVAQGDDYHARVMDGVKSNLFTGTDINILSVNKTWEIGKRMRPDQGETEVALQHLVADEGSIFNANRQFAYVSQYTAQGWDTSYPQNTPAAGSITSGSALANSGVNTRIVKGKISSAAYFTKLTGIGDTLLRKTRLWFNAYRTDYNNVLVYWSTKPEVNVKHFVVQRRLHNETSFSNRDTLLTKAMGGFSSSLLEYATNDPNNYTALSYYRLMIITYAGDTSYSNIVPIGGKPGGYELLLWPNPSAGRFYVGINGAAAVKYVAVFNVLGQLVHREAVNERTIIEMNIHLPGAYFVSFISHSGQLLETKKLLITGHP